MASNVSAFIEVYNESSRIETCLKSFQWADELIVFDKNSTDDTKKIAQNYATDVIDVPYTDASENILNNISNRSSKDWVCFPTASSLLHPDLVDYIVKLTTDSSFDFDIIALPYALYSFGIVSKRSPWSAQYKHFIYRRSSLVVSNKLHYEYTSNSKRIFYLKIKDNDALLYHLTHDNANNFFSRHMRYTNYESGYLLNNDEKYSLKKSLFEIFRSFIIVIFKKKSLKLGWDGIALSLAYLSYFIMKFVYTWDKKRENGDIIYPIIRKNISDLWDKKSYNDKKK
jgi:glycosyltransferase involved in cell wall biosynthesis